jgi:hypothetical protein
VHHLKTLHGDVINARLLGVEYRLAHIDLYLGFVGIDAPELRPDIGVRLLHLSEPQRCVSDRFQHIIQPGHLGQPVAVQINGARVMFPSPGIEPVAVN